MNRKKYCNIPACENNLGTTDSNIRLFRIPSVGNEDLRSKWMEAIRNLFGIDFKTSTANICSLHFDPNDITPRNHLRSGAVPSIAIKPNSNTNINSTIKVESTETFGECAFQYVNINGIIEQAKTAKQSQHLPPKKPDYCLKCIDYDVKLQISKDRNAKLMEKLRQMSNENKRLKAQIKYSDSRATGKQVQWERCQICNTKLAPNKPHLCMDVKDIACEYCSSSFKTTVELCKHLEVAKHIETIYECDKCPTVFSTATLLTFHRQSKLAHTQTMPDFSIIQDQTQSNNHDIDVPLTDRIFACAICNESYKHSKELKTHMTQIHLNRMVHLEHEPIPVDIRKNRFECYICKIELPSKRAIRQHLKLHIAARDKKCVVCTERLTANEIDWHICCFTSEKSIACDYCGSSFEAITKLLRHLEAAHNDRTIKKCSKCSQYFGMTKLIDWHERKHNDQPKLFACEKCEKRFTGKHLLKTHLKTHDKQINFLCSECGKGCTTAQQLSVHSLVHTAKTIQCPDCPLTFNNPHLFTDHREIHMNLKYKCNECNSTFTCKRYLIVHTRRKHKDSNEKRKFQCTECSLKFINLQRLNLHMRKHTGEKPFTCEYCEKKYAYKQDLLKHMQTHVGNNIYQCDRCDQGFRLAYELRHHSYTHYKEEKAKSEPMPCS